MLRIILTFILIYLIFRIFTSFVFPWIVNWYLKRFKERYYRENPGYRQQQQRKDNEVHVTGKVPETTKTDLGEYVDFEEIKEEDKDKRANEDKDQKEKQ